MNYINSFSNGFSNRNDTVQLTSQLNSQAMVGGNMAGGVRKKQKSKGMYDLKKEIEKRDLQEKAWHEEWEKQKPQNRNGDADSVELMQQQDVNDYENGENVDSTHPDVDVMQQQGVNGYENGENANFATTHHLPTLPAADDSASFAKQNDYADYLTKLGDNSKVFTSLEGVVKKLPVTTINHLAKQAKEKLGINQLKFFYETRVTQTETTIIDKYNFFSLTLHGIEPEFFKILDRTTGKDNILTRYTVSLEAFTYLLHNVYSYDLPINLLQWACWHRRTDIVLRILSYLSTSSDEYIKLYINYMVPRGLYKGFKAIDFVMIEKPTDQSSVIKKASSIASDNINLLSPVTTLKNIIAAIPTFVYQTRRYFKDLNTLEIRRLLISYGSDNTSDSKVMTAVLEGSKTEKESIYDIIIKTREEFVDEQENQENVILFEIKNGQAYTNGDLDDNIKLTGLNATKMYKLLEKSDSDDTKQAQTLRYYNKKPINKNVNVPPKKGIFSYFNRKDGGYKKTRKHKPQCKRNVRITKRSM